MPVSSQGMCWSSVILQSCNMYPLSVGCGRGKGSGHAFWLRIKQENWKKIKKRKVKFSLDSVLHVVHHCILNTVYSILYIQRICLLLSHLSDHYQPSLAASVFCICSEWLHAHLNTVWCTVHRTAPERVPQCRQTIPQRALWEHLTPSCSADLD